LSANCVILAAAAVKLLPKIALAISAEEVGPFLIKIRDSGCEHHAATFFEFEAFLSYRSRNSQ
jgi:hypothetical protein